MCRLFGMSAVPRRVRATFWLVDAPDSLALQSRTEPDGVGLGAFASGGTPLIYKRPVAEYQDTGFAWEAHELSASTFIAHMRYATTGALRPSNTDPFCQDNRLFAHNGVVDGLDRLDDKVHEELHGPADELVQGDTDSERVFALITAYARQGRDLGQAMTDAIGWIAAHLPVYAINLILTTPTELWALRHPDTHKLYVPPRPAGGGHGNRHLEHVSAPGTVRVRSADLAAHGFALIDARTASPQELLDAEQRLGATLPSQYKTFMMHYGVGQFGSVDLLPVTPISGREDVVSVSQREDPAGSFVAVAPVGSGDYWGFSVVNGRCSDQVWFRFHDAGDPELAANDFLTFVANHGLTV